MQKCFSGEYKVHDYEAKLSVLSINLFIGCTSPYSGSVPDFEILCENSGFHDEASKSLLGDLIIFDERLTPYMKGDIWAIIAEK